MIQIKDYKVLRALMQKTYHPKLMALMMWATVRYSKVVITEAWREAIHSGDVHSTIPGRGIDIRSWVFPDPQKVADDINANWIYDPERPNKMCAVLHDAGQGEHFHLQVHNRTEYKNDGQKLKKWEE